MLVDSLWVLGTRFVQRAANLVVLFFLARALSLAEFGYYGYAVATLLMLSVAFDVGLRQVVAQEIGRPEADMAAVVRDTFLLWMALGLAMTCVMAGVMRLGAPPVEGAAALPAILAALAALPTLLVRMGQGVLLGQGRVKELNASELAGRAALLGGTALLWSLGRLDLAAALGLLLASSLLSAVVLGAQVCPKRPPETPFRAAPMLPWLRRGLAFLTGTLAMIMLGRVGVWVLGGVLSAEELGLYVGAMRLAEMLAEVATAVGIVIFSHGVRQADRKAAVADAVRTARVVTAVMALAAFVGAVCAGPLLALVLGPAYAAAAPAFRVCLIGAVAACQGLMLYPCLSAQGKPWLGAFAFVPATLLAALLAWWLGARYGLMGAAWAFALAQIAAALGFLLLYRLRFGLPVWTSLLPQPEDFAGLARFVPRAKSV